MDAGKYYALLRFEEAALGLRAALRMRLVDELGDRQLSLDALQREFGFTTQATRTYVALLEVMEVLQKKGDKVSVAPRAAKCLSEDSPSSRQPYLSMGSGADVDAFIDLLKGCPNADVLPLYGSESAGKTLMDDTEAARAIAFGLASRAKNFAEPMAQAIRPFGGKARRLADIGAGSPYIAQACLTAMPFLEKAILVDRPNAMQFIRELAESHGDSERLEYLEQDFFQSVPAADIYCISNTAHDWLPEEYAAIMKHVRDAIAPGGIVCIHEPLLCSTWNSAEQWVHALWMACYAVTLFRLTNGKGTCYTRAEHDLVLSQSGFVPTGDPIATGDGCTALVYRLESEARPEMPSPLAQTATY